jgi:hypothetical protein
MPVTVVAAISRRCWRCEKAGDRAHSSTDRSAESGTVTTGSSSSDCSPTACADETTADKTLDRIIWIGAS